MSRILWIEDEGKTEYLHYKVPMIRAGHTVDIVVDATEAIHFLREKEYDAMILDLIIMEGNNFETNEEYVGLGLLRRIVNQQIPNVIFNPSKIIVYTVIDNPKIHEEIRKLGVNEIVVKPLFDITELKKRIDKLLGITNE